MISQCDEQIIVIDITVNGRVGTQALLYLDHDALFNLASNPIPTNVTGYKLFDALKQRGAIQTDVLNQNGSLQAAWSEFDIESGALTRVVHYRG
jgi:hypothetical protein